jgi:hypothetical protein
VSITDDIEIERDYEESKSVDIEVVDEIPSPNFNPPLIVPFDLILIRPRVNFSDSSLFFSDVLSTFLVIEMMT